MFNKCYVVVAETEEEVHRMIKIATNHRLYVTYKLGVYGSEHQHELFIIGKPWHYRKFKRAIGTTIAKIDNKEGRVQ